MTRINTISAASFTLIDADGDAMGTFATEEAAEQFAAGHVRHPRLYPEPWCIRGNAPRPTVDAMLAASPSTSPHNNLGRMA